MSKTIPPPPMSDVQIFADLLAAGKVLADASGTDAVLVAAFKAAGAKADLAERAVRQLEHEIMKQRRECMRAAGEALALLDVLHKAHAADRTVRDAVHAARSALPK